MPVFEAATDVSEIELPEPGKYTVKCVSIEDAPDKGFGPGVKWVFQLIDPVSGITYQSRFGGDYELWQFTSVKMGQKSKARQFIEALLGRPLDVAKREVPDVRQLVGAQMTAMVIHEKRDDGSDKAVVTSCKPLAEAGAAAAAPPSPPRPAQSVAFNAPPTGSPVRDQLRSSIRKAQILGTANAEQWSKLDVDTLNSGDLVNILEMVRMDIEAA